MPQGHIREAYAKKTAVLCSYIAAAMIPGGTLMPISATLVTLAASVAAAYLGPFPPAVLSCVDLLPPAAGADSGSVFAGGCLKGHHSSSVYCGRACMRRRGLAPRNCQGAEGALELNPPPPPHRVSSAHLPVVPTIFHSSSLSTAMGGGAAWRASCRRRPRLGYSYAPSSGLMQRIVSAGLRPGGEAGQHR